LKNIYIPNPHCDMTELAEKSREFALDFPTLPHLVTLSASISSPNPFTSVIPSKSLRNMYFNALIWLLKEDLVVQMHIYIRLVASPEVKARAREVKRAGGSFDEAERTADDGDVSASSLETRGESFCISEKSNPRGLSRTRYTQRQSSLNSESELASSTSPALDPRGIAIVDDKTQRKPHPRRKFDQSLANSKVSSDGSLGIFFEPNESVEPEDATEPGQSSVIREPGQPTTWERRWLLQIAAGKDEDVVERFQRILPFLNGRHHLEAISFHSGLSRREIRAVLAAFESDVVTFLAQ